jgi:hypothetical protein
MRRRDSVEQQRPHWAQQMAEPPFTKSRFTDEVQQRILQKVNAKKPHRRMQVWAASLITAVLIAVVIGFSGAVEWLNIRSAPTHTEPPSDIEFQNEYYENDKLLFAVFPDPYLEAGREFGYTFHFSAPFETFRDRMLSIYAVHIESGEKVIVQKPIKITEPSSGYSSLQRFTTFVGLPISGKWRFFVELNGRDYGDVSLNVKEATWVTTSEFKSGSYWLRGIPGNAGFIDAGFIAGKMNKYMWHFWGSEDELKGNFHVKAVKQGETRLLDIFEGKPGIGKHNGADATLPSSMSLPEPGLWRLLPYLDDRLLQSIVVEVKAAP